MKKTLAAFLAASTLASLDAGAQGPNAASVPSGNKEQKPTPASTGMFSIDGASLAAEASGEQADVDDIQARIAEAFAKVTSCLVVEPVAGKNGKPLRISPTTSEAEITVRARVDEARYQAFVTELLNTIAPLATFDKKAFGKFAKKPGTGESEFWDNGGCWIPMPISNQDPDKIDRDKLEDESGRILYVVENTKTGKTRVLQFDKEIAETIKQEMDIGDLAFRVCLVDADEDDVVEPVVKAVNETKNGKERDCNTAAIFVDMAGTFHGHPNNGVLALGLILPRLGGAFRISYGSNDDNPRYHEIAPDAANNPVVSEKRFTISLGTIDAETLKSVAGVKFDVGRMKDGEFLED